MLDVKELFASGTEHQCNTALKVLSRSGVPNIIFSLESGPKRFSQIMFDVKLNPGVLDRHLKALADIGVVKKNGGVYELTDKGYGVAHVLKLLKDIL